MLKNHEIYALNQHPYICICGGDVCDTVTKFALLKAFYQETNPELATGGLVRR